MFFTKCFSLMPGAAYLATTLENKGFLPITRDVVLLTAYCGAFASVLGALIQVFAPFGTWILWFGLAMLLSAWNFYGLAKFVHQSISNGWNGGLLVRLLLRTQWRLFLTGFFIYSALVWFGAPISALLCGLTILLAFIIVCKCLR